MNKRIIIGAGLKQSTIYSTGTYTCISYNTGKSALPDIDICTMPEGVQRLRASAYTYMAGNA